MNNPGPGKYEVAKCKDKLRTKSPVCTIGKSSRHTLFNHSVATPGPSDYKINYNINKTRGPTYHIQSKMSPKRDDNSPGPGSYHREDSV